MNSNTAFILVIISAFLAASSQMLLKTSAQREYNNWIFEYINWRVMLSYGTLFVTSFINMYALRFLPYKLVPMLGTLSYIFVIFFSKMILHEKMGIKKKFGAILILIGIIIFNLNK